MGSPSLLGWNIQTLSQKSVATRWPVRAKQSGSCSLKRVLEASVTVPQVLPQSALRRPGKALQALPKANGMGCWVCGIQHGLVLARRGMAESRAGPSSSSSYFGRCNAFSNIGTSKRFPYSFRWSSSKYNGLDWMEPWQISPSHSTVAGSIMRAPH